MKKLRRPGLSIERLEARDCPALSMYYNAGSLVIRGVPNGNLLVQGTVGTTFHVTDNGNNLGFYALTGNLSVLLNSRPAELDVDLAGVNLPGNLSIDLGGGYTGAQANNSVDIYSTVPGGNVPGGTIFGNVNLQRGNSAETYNIGANFTDSGAALPVLGAININGSVTASGRIAQASKKGNALNVHPGTNILGNLSMSQINGITIGQTLNGTGGLTTIAGSLIANAQGSPNRITVGIKGNILGNVTVIGTNLNDSFTMAQQSAGVGGTILGNLTFAGGNGGAGKNFNLAPGTTVGGSVAFLDGNNAGVALASGDLLVLNGNINGSATLNLGNGVENIDFSQNVTNGIDYGNIGGDLNITSGNGTNIFGAGILSAMGWTGTVGGGVNMQLGNGANSVTILGDTTGGALGFTVGNTLSVHMGDGTNSVEISDNSAGAGLNVIPLNIVYGPGTNSFTIDAGTTRGNLEGLINFNFGNDHYIPNGYVWTTPIQLLNL